MCTSRRSLVAGCAGGVVLTMSVAGAGAALFELLCGATHALNWDAGLVVAWVERFAVAGLMAVTVGVCGAGGHAANFAASDDRGEKEPIRNRVPPSGRAAARPAHASARRHE